MASDFTLGDEPILFFMRSCSLCPEAIVRTSHFFNAEGIRLMVRPGFSGLSEIVPGYPALYIPQGLWDLPQPMLLVGSQIHQYLQELKAQTIGQSESPE